MKTFYHNGTILTMEDHALYAEAVCTENGKILMVGTEEEVMAQKTAEDEVIDLRGKTMMPGFIDAHSHFAGTANSMTQCDLSSCKNFSDIVEALKEFREKRHLSDECWIVGCNYDQNFLEEGVHPTRYVLDQVGGTNPVLIVHASSHMGVTNSKGLKIQGIDDGIEDCPGGRYGRLKDGKTPDGYMEEKAFLKFQSALPMTSVEQLMELMKEAQDLYASYGITTVQDGMVARPLFELLKYASSLGIFKLDIVGFVDVTSALELFEEEPLYVNQYCGHFKLGGCKIFLDGSPQGKTAWMSSPYQGEEEYCGYPIYQDKDLKEYIKKALSRHQQLLAHCNGDAAAEQYISCFEQVNKEGKKELYRPVMIHAQLVREDQLKRMAALGMMASFFVAHTYYWGDIHLKNFGEKRGKMISPVKSAINEGVNYTFHQDTPVVPPDMMRTVWCAVNRISKTGKDIGEEQRITVLEALKGITVNGACQYFEEQEKGTIRPGKKADFVLLDRDPLKTDPKNLAEIRVMMTIKENKVVYKREQ